MAVKPEKIADLFNTRDALRVAERSLIAYGAFSTEGALSSLYETIRVVDGLIRAANYAPVE